MVSDARSSSPASRISGAFGDGVPPFSRNDMHKVESAIEVDQRACIALSGILHPVVAAASVGEKTALLNRN